MKMDTQHLPKFKKISLACIPGHSLMRNGMATYNPRTKKSIFLSRKHRPFRLQEKSSAQEWVHYSVVTVSSKLTHQDPHLLPNKTITKDESSLPPACALPFAQNSTRRVKFVSWKPNKQSCWFPMGALGSFRSSESAQPHVRLWLQLALRTEAASGPLIPLLQAGVGSPTEEAPTHGTCQTRSQEGAGGQGQNSGHDSLFSCFCLHTFRRPLLRKPQARSSAQVSKPSLIHNQLQDFPHSGPDPLLKRVPSPEILKLGLWASRELKNWGPKRPSYDLFLSLFVLWDIKEKI